MSSYRPSNDRHGGGGGRSNDRRPPQNNFNTRRYPARNYDDRDYDRNRRPTSPRRDNRNRDSYKENSHHDFRPPQGDFNFRFDKPAGVGDFAAGDSYRPNPSRRPGPAARGGRGRGRGRGNFRSRHPADRELLKGERQVRENLVDDDDQGTTYRNVEDLSDDEEAAMDISDQSDQDEEADEQDEPATKRARLAADDSETGNSVPKWSNPEADAALPADSAQRKGKDMVKLIRKARVEDNAAAAKLAASTDAEEFISFDMDALDDESEDGQGEAKAQEVPPPDAPSGPRAQQAEVSASAAGNLPPPPLPSFQKDPITLNTGVSSKGDLNGHPRQPIDSRPPPSNDPLGSRKRTFDDEIKPPSYGPLKKVSKMPVQGHVVPDWEPTKKEEPCPWLVRDHSLTSEMSTWLHKEIVDFYEFVRPRKFEHAMRSHLIERLETALAKSFKYRDCKVYPFGSYMSGLYLPTADMDIVICSREWSSRGFSAFISKNSLYKFKAFLNQTQLAAPDTIEVIAGAKVPLVKYIDRMTGLRVDVSFDRMDGPAAIDTFLQWKEQYPALPMLITVIKHFLAMRGLNEPVNGGIGSFSVSCMVMSMLQLHPAVQSRSMVPEHHLGDMLMEFFDLYGNNFDYENVAIRLSPPGYVNKSARNHNITYKNRSRLSIIDPNNSENDISGGSSNAPVILYDFHSAYRMITERMAELSQRTREGSNRASILETVLAGNYSSFRLQRSHLRQLHEKYIGPCED